MAENNFLNNPPLLLLFCFILLIFILGYRKKKNEFEREGALAGTYQVQNPPGLRSSHKKAPLKTVSCALLGNHPPLKDYSKISTRKDYYVGEWVLTSFNKISHSTRQSIADSYGTYFTKDDIPQIPTHEATYEFHTKYRVTVNVCKDCMKTAQFQTALRNQERNMYEYEESKNNLREHNKSSTIFETTSGCWSVPSSLALMYIGIPLLVIVVFSYLFNPNSFFDSIMGFLTDSTSSKLLIPILFFVILIALGSFIITSIWWAIRSLSLSASVQKRGKELKTRDIMSYASDYEATENVMHSILAAAFPKYNYLELNESRKYHEQL